MKKLGKKVKLNKKSLQVYTASACSICSCATSSVNYASMYSILYTHLN